jgi:hypothetical protein
MSLIRQLLAAATEFFRWRAKAAEIDARRLELTEYERVEDEIRDLEKEINRLRSRGSHDAAVLLLKRQARRARFALRLDHTAQGADVHSSA